MHEVSLVAELVDAVVRESGGVPVARVRVRCASTLPQDVLRQAWEMLVPGTGLEAAALVVDPFDVRLGCPCGFEGALGHDDLIGPAQAVCPACGELRGIAATAELELLEVRAGGPPVAT